MRSIFRLLLKEVAWAPFAVIVGHWLFADIFGHEPYVDPIMHFLGGAAAAYFLRRLAELSPAMVGRPSKLGHDLLAFGLCCVAALIWEFGELASDIFLGTNIQRSAPNTLRDLALGASGGFAVLLLLRALRRSSREDRNASGDGIPNA